MGNSEDRNRPDTDSLDTLVAELVPVGIVRTDANGGCVYVNKRWCQLTGLRREAAYGTGWARAVHPEDRDWLVEEWQKAASQGTEFVADFRYQTPDGTVRTVSSRTVPLFAEDGRLSGYIGAITDVSDRLRAEETARKVTRQLAERGKELDCLFGLSHIVEQSGGSLEDVFTGTVELLPPSWQYPDIACARIVIDDSEFKTANFLGSRWKQRSAIMANGETRGFIEVCYLEERPQKDEGPFLKEERRLIDDVAERLGHLTEHTVSEELLRHKEHELRERLTHMTRVSTVGEMASSIAHEVNQPLTAIATYTQACSRLLESDKADDRQLRDVLKRITDEALRAGAIIHRLKDLVRKGESKRTVCDINTLVEDVEQLASVDARLHNVGLRLELSQGLPPILADGVQIQQVILNLIRNGIDATQCKACADRVVIVKTESDNGAEVVVSVQDNGCGVPLDVNDELFQPFFTTKESGMGMGLSISRSIVILHGGRMWYEAKQERGATFFFSIPTQAEED